MEYQIIRSSRGTIAIQIMPEGRVLVRCPQKMSVRQIDDFVRSKQGWIEKHLKLLADRPREPAFTCTQLQSLAGQALQDLPMRATRFASLVGVHFGNITIHAQRSRWGSCSSRGNLNFNCLLMLVPEKVRDYVVVHELCHLIEGNHSARFWAEVERILPDYRRSRDWLKVHGGVLIARLGQKYPCGQQIKKK